MVRAKIIYHVGLPFLEVFSSWTTSWSRRACVHASFGGTFLERGIHRGCFCFQGFLGHAFNKLMHFVFLSALSTLVVPILVGLQHKNESNYDKNSIVSKFFRERLAEAYQSGGSQGQNDESEYGVFWIHFASFFFGVENLVFQILIFRRGKERVV